MEQETVMYRATILDPPTEPVPVPELICEPCEPEPTPAPKSEPKPEPKRVKPCPKCPDEFVPLHPMERLEQDAILLNALPSIFIGFGIAYAIGILTGAIIFSPPSVYLE